MKRHSADSTRSKRGTRAGIVALSLSLIFSLSANFAVAAAPVISTAWTISNGAVSPLIFLDGVDFALGNDKFDFTVDVGTTELEYDSVAFVDTTHMRFTFHGTAKTGTITIQANPSAFFPMAAESSNTISIVVAAPLTPQTITFTLPTTMTVKDADQPPNTTSTSGLTVVLTSNTPSVCTIDFLKIHAVAAGTCSITASVAGTAVFSQAIPVTRSFMVLAIKTENPNEPTPPVQEVTNLGSATYDPNHTDNDYVSVLVAALSSDPKDATVVKLLIPPKATDTSAVFLISSFSTDAETKAGYFVARITSVASNTSLISLLKKPIEINIPAGATGTYPSWSSDGLAWTKLVKLQSEALPADVRAGYFVEKDGRIAILSEFLAIFGYRKDQSPLTIFTTALSIDIGRELQVLTSGGSGTGALTYFSRTPEICSTSPSGLVTGLNTGKCLVSARKAASGIYANAISSAITVYVQSEASANNPPTSDPNSSALCNTFTYSLAKSSALVYADLCKEHAGESATLEIGTKSKTGVWSYKVAKRQLLDGNGATLFKLSSPLKIGQIIRVKTAGKVQITTTIKTK